VLAIPLPHLNAHHAGHPFRQVHTSSQFQQLFVGWAPCYAHEVGLLQTIPRMRDPIGKFSVVRYQNQTFASPIKSSYWKEPFFGGNEIDHPRAMGWIEIRRHHSRRFV
jgi:hypothetical protein